MPFQFEYDATSETVGTRKGRAGVRAVAVLLLRLTLFYPPAARAIKSGVEPILVRLARLKYPSLGQCFHCGSRFFLFCFDLIRLKIY
jgi:hypothetical protein